MKNFDIFVNIIKRPELITYKSRVTAQSANIAYVGSAALSSDANINIQDKSGSLAPNRVVEDIKTYNSEQTVTTETSDFLLTDIFTDGTNSAPSQPLFFQHKFKNYDPETEYISSVRTYDDLFNEVEFVYKKLDEEKGLFYSNVTSFYNVIPDQKSDPGGIEYTYYYISYNVTNKTTLSSNSYRELLDNQPVFREAGFSDYDPDTLLLDVNSKSYTISSTPDGFEISLPGPTNFAIDSKRDAKLKTLWPTSKDYSDPWHIRVSNGKFYYQGALYKIAESQFNSQSFNPQLGIKRVQKETPTILKKNIIKLDNEDVINDADLGLYVLVRVTKDSGTTYGFTTNSANADSSYLYYPTDEKGIASIDTKTGFVELINFDLKSTDVVSVDYYYNEKYYDYNKVDFNPLRNEPILSKMITFYIDPTDSSGSLKHGEFNELGKAIGPADFLTSTINGQDVFPTPSDPTLNDFLQHTTENSGPLFVLSNVTVGESSGVRNLTTLDTRLEGGGIREDKVQEVKDKYPEYMSFFNSGSWDGIPFPGNLTSLIKVPIKGTLEDYEGKISIKQVKDIVNNHIALGAYPIVKAYGPEIKFNSENSVEVLKVDATNSDVKLNWKAVGNTTYNVFYRKVTDNNWSTGPSITPTPLSNRVQSMSAVIANLPGGHNYYFTVIGQETINGVSVDLFTQHISSDSSSLKTKEDFPDSLNVIEAKILIL